MVYIEGYTSKVSGARVLNMRGCHKIPSESGIAFRHFLGRLPWRGRRIFSFNQLRASDTGSSARDDVEGLGGSPEEGHQQGLRRSDDSLLSSLAAQQHADKC